MPTVANEVCTVPPIVWTYHTPMALLTEGKGVIAQGLCQSFGNPMILEVMFMKDMAVTYIQTIHPSVCNP